MQTENKYLNECQFINGDITISYTEISAPTIYTINNKTKQLEKCLSDTNEATVTSWQITHGGHIAKKLQMEPFFKAPLLLPTPCWAAG